MHSCWAPSRLAWEPGGRNSRKSLRFPEKPDGGMRLAFPKAKAPAAARAVGADFEFLS